MGGSMGAVVGEKFVRAAELCLEKRVPLVCFSASGGAYAGGAVISNADGENICGTRKNA